MARSDALPKFLGTTAINMPGSIAKDQALTKLFGVVGGAAKVPAASFALFTVRDVATMAAAFTLPTPMSAKVRKTLEKKKRTKEKVVLLYRIARTWFMHFSAALFLPGSLVVWSRS